MDYLCHGTGTTKLFKKKIVLQAFLFRTFQLNTNLGNEKKETSFQILLKFHISCSCDTEIARYPALGAGTQGQPVCRGVEVILFETDQFRASLDHKTSIKLFRALQ